MLKLESKIVKPVSASHYRKKTELIRKSYLRVLSNLKAGFGPSCISASEMIQAMKFRPWLE